MQPDVKDAGYLLDMLEHARGVVQALQDRSVVEYLADENLRLAIERRIEIIGEAANRISTGFQDAHPEIPWRKIVAQRNILAHEYGEVQAEIIWRVATVSIPDPIAALEPLIPPLPQAGG